MGRAEKVETLREDVVVQLQEILAIKQDEVNIIQEQLAKLSKNYVKEQHMTDPFGDTGMYTGQTRDGKAHGRGTMEYDDGRLYVGDWNQGSWHGAGRATFANGDSYEGNYKFDQRHGMGTYRWNDGRVFTGGFDNDLRQGKGRYWWPDGACYEGDFVAGQHHGTGTYEFADGSKYSGMWSGGLYNGQGTLEWSDGRVYTGKRSTDERVGTCFDLTVCSQDFLMALSPLPSQLLSGEWKDGQAHGHGKETNPDGSIRHDGEWHFDRPVRDAPVKV
jgi:hypothetical protein